MTVPVSPGQLYLIDTSAHARGDPSVRTVIAGLIADRVAATCVTVDLGAGCSGRDAGDVGAVVLHDDADFEHIAASTGQPHAWIVRRGSID